jgi:hypothetical protein
MLILMLDLRFKLILQLIWDHGMSFDLTMQIVVRYDYKNLTLVLLNIYHSLTSNLFEVETIGIVCLNWVVLDL